MTEGRRLKGFVFRLEILDLIFAQPTEANEVP